MSALRWFAEERPVLVLGFLLAAMLAAAQSPAEHVFQVSRTELDKALQSVHAHSPGRLPTLEGFVGPEVPALEKYQRAYYQYKLEVRPASSGATLLRVSVKVTAWYSGDNPAQAGYRVLPSNGRLETDLVERLEEALQQTSANAASTTTATLAPAATTERSSMEAGRGAAPTEPSTFHTSLPPPQPASRADLAPPNAQELAQQKRVQQLTEQATNLEEILRNQARPNDLAAVLKNGTPVLAKPVAGEVLFQADAEDEFKVLDESEGWVHVQISGISRGWIRRSELEMPFEANAAADTGSKAAAAAPGPETHEETSLFPGDWSALRGRMVRITWVRPESGAAPGGTDRWQLARSAFRDTYSHVNRSGPKVEGVVIVIDAADGGMIAATTNALRRWDTGAISDAAFRKECWADPPEALGETAQRKGGAESQNQ